MSGRSNNGKSSVVVGSPSREPRTTILSRNGREPASSSGDVRNTGQKSAGKSNSTAVNGRSSDISTSGVLDGGNAIMQCIVGYYSN